MTGFRAVYHDGCTSNAIPVEVAMHRDGQLQIRGEGVDHRAAGSSVRVSTRLGNSPRYLHLPDGARCETLDNDAVDAVVRALGRRRILDLPRFEARLHLVIGAVVLTAIGIWAVVQHGVPWAARHIAFSLPDEAEGLLAREALQRLDEYLFEPSALTPAERERIQRLFYRVSAASGEARELTLELRAAETIGANAFALPAGIVIVTDDLVWLAEHDEELLAVMAHEAGHVVGRHSLRQLIQSSATAVFIGALLGDLSAISGLSAALPTILVDQGYSRGFEREADRYAAEFLAREGVALDRFAAILARLGDDEPEANGWLDYLSSHPATSERIESLTGRGH